jgi:hypothetical protein
MYWLIEKQSPEITKVLFSRSSILRSSFTVIEKVSSIPW